ncbi:MAG: sporulation protein Cse60 [Bacillales bacterium]|nr:sporulation protein Cse60 [Bacillales bacterium]
MSYNITGDKVKVKIFDESHEHDLELKINKFLNENDIEIIDIKYQVSISVFSEEQIYCFSSMIIYK